MTAMVDVLTLFVQPIQTFSDRHVERERPATLRRVRVLQHETWAFDISRVERNTFSSHPSATIFSKSGVYSRVYSSSRTTAQHPKANFEQQWKIIRHILFGTMNECTCELWSVILIRLCPFHINYDFVPCQADEIKMRPCTMPAADSAAEQSAAW